MVGAASSTVSRLFVSCWHNRRDFLLADYPSRLGSEFVTEDRRVAVIAGGVGAAKFLRGLLNFYPNELVTAVVNIADDFRLHGLAISPDLDTVTYTVSSQVNSETGWGRSGESWRVLEELAKIGGHTWFSLGDLDLALHLYRTQRLTEGATLSDVTHEICAAWGITARLLPATNETVSTRLKVSDKGWLDFQDYFVVQRHNVPITDVRFDGIDDASPGPGVIESLEEADVVIIAPSNPIVSVNPVLEISGIREVLLKKRESVVAISPIVGGAALKGPAARMLDELGHESSAVGVAVLYKDVARTLVVDHVDAELSARIEAEGVRALITDTIMSDQTRAAALAKTTLESVFSDERGSL